MVIFSLAFTPIAKYLFNNNAAGKVDIVDAKGKSPLLKACVNNHLAVVKLLVDKYHADVNLPDSEASFFVYRWEGGRLTFINKKTDRKSTRLNSSHT